MVKNALNMKSVRLLSKTVALSTVLSLGGCASTSTVPTSDTTTPESASRPVVLLDEDMENYVAVDNLTDTRNENSYLIVQANIRSRSDKDMTLQAQTLFYDKNGVILNSSPGDEAPWVTIPLSANSLYPYKVQSLTAHARKYCIRLRYLARPRG